MGDLPVSDVAGAAQRSATGFASTPWTEDALQALLASIVESSNDAIVSKSLDGIVMTWNRAAERIFGYTAREMIGCSILKLAVPGHTEDITRVLERVRQGERVDHYETIRRTKYGQIIHVSLTVSPIRDRTGKVIGASKIARDITDSKQAEELNAAPLDEIRQSATRKWVHADLTRMTQVVDDLLENAGKFTEHGGTIEVEVIPDSAERQAILRIRDTGIGIDPELLSRMFDLFAQADRSLDRRQGGPGLGLTLVKRLEIGRAHV